MSLDCPHCKAQPEYSWIDWEKHALFQLHFTPAMRSLSKSRGSTDEEESIAFLCECPLCKKQVVYTKNVSRLSDITSESEYDASTVESMNMKCVLVARKYD